MCVCLVAGFIPRARLTARSARKQGRSLPLPGSWQETPAGRCGRCWPESLQGRASQSPRWVMDGQGNPSPAGWPRMAGRQVPDESRSLNGSGHNSVTPEGLLGTFVSLGGGAETGLPTTQSQWIAVSSISHQAIGEICIGLNPLKFPA